MIGTRLSATIAGAISRGVISASVNENAELVLTMSDGSTITVGVVGNYLQYNAEMSLTDAQQEQARSNIGAIADADYTAVVDDVTRDSLSEIISALITYIGKMVRYDQAQILTDAQQEQARSNIGAIADTDYNSFTVDGWDYMSLSSAIAALINLCNNFLRFDADMLLSDDEQGHVWNSLGLPPITEDLITTFFEGGSSENSYTKLCELLDDMITQINKRVTTDAYQGLTAEEQEAARENIGAVADDDYLASIDGTNCHSLSDIIAALYTYIGKMVRYDKAQTLTAAQKSRVRTTIGIENIPTVSASDNGKVMQVVDGAWTAVTIENAAGGSY